MSKSDFPRTIRRLVLGRQSSDYRDAARAERQYNRRVRAEVEEAQWTVETVDWPVSHPDDVADDDGFRLLGSTAYVQALDGLGASYAGQPVAGPADQPTG
ncbi:MAG TPA: hypothetical protein VGL47_20110 [Amycolatopsis sp.]|uniref:Uncharacterized protein n=1 Tax=Amycolatopsis nalaikhensis TaxID=715472 RepID=A0ABY8XGZ8_9PSEU|nr:hypothetical protein [Amycolatopsis sp. 2-2]WIV54900.1 hypothetical protein QP939_39670 [Amycolatopsis sp. 2-2]